MRHTTTWLLLPLALLTACGSSDSDTPAPTPAGGAAGSGGKAGAGGAAAGTGGSAGQAGTGGAAGKGGGASGAGTGGSAGKSGGSGQAGAGGAGAGGASGAGAGGQAGAGMGGGAGAGQGGAGAGQGGSGGAGQAGSAGMAGQGPCGGGCMDKLVCKHDTCVPDLGTCTTNDDCPGDSYCDVDQTCVPYGVPPTKTNDPTCQKPKVPTDVKPTVQCEWLGPPAGDPTATYTEIYTTPVVAELNLDLDPNKIQPSIIVNTFDFDIKERTGMLRVFDGRTCQEQMRIGGPDDPDIDNNRPSYASGWAIGDLDGDVGTPGGHPEIVGFHRIGFQDGFDPITPIAFGVDTTDPQKPKLVRRWHGHDCVTGEMTKIFDNASNVVVGLHDLDDDGVPEVVVDRLVFSAEGCVLNAGQIPNLTSYDRLSVISTIADVDLDGKPDLVHYDGIYGWDTAKKDWTLKPWAVSSPDLTAGNVAVADLGAYSAIPGHPKTDPLPEVIVTANGTVRVQDLTGAIVFGPFPIHQGGRGGPPTAADFDGDGQVEFAAAGAIAYTVYDPDCLASPDAAARPGGTCLKSEATLPEGILWTQPSQDKSSNVTGSSVFDFNGDGQAEVVYRDECFLRVYEGKTGKVLYSAPASSGTGYEYPTVVDADGDFATEIVVPRTHIGSCPAGPDPLFPTSGDATSTTGFAVLRDAEDRWVSSRPIWNQHAYSITHVTDDARIVKSSEVKRNWEQPGLNNFRQNTQGALGATAIADLTVVLQDADSICDATGGMFTVKAKVCNRGTNPVQDGAQVLFSQKDTKGVASPLCSAITSTLLAPGDCTEVSCTGDLGDGNDVLVSVDPAALIADCHPGNNEGASARSLCKN